MKKRRTFRCSKNLYIYISKYPFHVCHIYVATNFSLEALINLNQFVPRPSIKRNDHAEKTLYKIYFLDI